MILAPESAPIRTVALWVPDWPVIAALRVADLSPHLPAAVMSSQHRVVAASAVARAFGVRRGMRKRTAQSHCPDLVLLPDDGARDAGQFEHVAAAVDRIVSGLEVMRPGILLIPAAGAARYHGGEPELVEALIEAVSEAGFECQVGLADGILAAVLAAREELIVPAGESPDYLSPRPVTDLLTIAVGAPLTDELSNAISLWLRLGLNTLGELVALPREAMAGRFGPLGVWAQRLARGQDLRPPANQRPDEDIMVEQKFDPPLYQTEPAVAAGQLLAGSFVDLMSQRSLACGRIQISATTQNGTLSRVWRTDDGALGGMSAPGITQRLRWQLDSWLTTSPDRAPILSLEILAQEIAPANTYQSTLWGRSSGSDVRASRALGNVQGILGLDQVQMVALQGERTPWDQTVRFTFGAPVPTLNDLADPWPAALPTPAPTTIFSAVQPVQVLSQQGRQITVAPRLMKLSEVPKWLATSGGNLVITDWAGPWLVPQNWWDGHPLALGYMQVILDNGTAYLLEYAQAVWGIRGVYD